VTTDGDYSGKIVHQDQSAVAVSYRHRCCPGLSVTAPRNDVGIWESWREVTKGVEGNVLQNGREVGRCGGSGEMVAVLFRKRRMWTKVLRCRMMWRGCRDKEWCCWCVKSSDKIQIVYGITRNGSRVVDELYLKRLLLVLEKFLFFSL